MDWNLESVKRDIVTACQIMNAKKLAEAYGHFSARIPHSDRFLIIPRLGPGQVRSPQEILTMTLSGQVVEGEGVPPVEYPIHSRIYLKRPDVMAICRTQSLMNWVFGALGEPVRPVHGFGTFLGEEVPVYLDAELVHSDAQGDALAQVLGEGEAVLLRGNGAAVVGKTVAEACVKAIFLEHTLRVLHPARTLGEPLYYSTDEIRRRTNVGYDHWGRAWEYYKHELGLT